MKEKKYLRLLPFRARQPETRGASGVSADAHGDEELSRLLRAWAAPDAPRAADARLLAAFRRQTTERAPSWRRLLTASVRVPVPVAALSVLALLAVTATLIARPSHVSPVTAAAAAPHATETTKIVEVPVVQERVVTRIVYVEKNGRRVPRAGDENLSERERPEQRVTQRQQQPLAGVQSRSAHDADAQGTGYFTRVDMEEFRPAEQMNFRIIQRGNGDEK